MVRLLLLAAFLIPALIVAVRSQYVSLLLYAWFTMFAVQDWVYTDISWMRLSLVLGVLTLLPRDWIGAGSRTPDGSDEPLATHGLPNLTHPLSIGALLFLGCAAVAQHYAYDAATGWKWLDYLWRVILSSVVAVTLLSTRKRVLWLVAVIGGSIALHSAKAGLSSLLAGGVHFNNGLGGAFSDNNGYALVVAMALPFMVAAARNVPSRWMRVAFWAAVPLSMFTIVSTYSRGGFLALIAATLTFLALQRRRVAAFAVLGVCLLAALVVVPIPQQYLDRLQTIRTYEEVEEDSALSRLYFWNVAIRMAEDHPLGIGLFNFEKAYDSYDTTGGQYGTKRAVHSSHFQVLAEQGYPGLAVWLGSFAVAFFLAFRARWRARAPGRSAEEERLLFTMSNALIVSMVAFLVGGSFLAAALNEFTWMTFAIVAAVDRLAARPPVGAAAVLEAPAAVPVPAPAVFQGAYRRRTTSSEVPV